MTIPRSRNVIALTTEVTVRHQKFEKSVLYFCSVLIGNEEHTFRPLPFGSRSPGNDKPSKRNDPGRHGRKTMLSTPAGRIPVIQNHAAIAITVINGGLGLIPSRRSGLTWTCHEMDAQRFNVS